MFGYSFETVVDALFVPVLPNCLVARVARRALPPPRPMAQTRSPRRSPRRSRSRSPRQSPPPRRRAALAAAVRPEGGWSQSRADLAVAAHRCASAPALRPQPLPQTPGGPDLLALPHDAQTASDATANTCALAALRTRIRLYIWVYLGISAIAAARHGHMIRSVWRHLNLDRAESATLCVSRA